MCARSALARPSNRAMARTRCGGPARRLPAKRRPGSVRLFLLDGNPVFPDVDFNAISLLALAVQLITHGDSGHDEYADNEVEGAAAHIFIRRSPEERQPDEKSGSEWGLRQVPASFSGSIQSIRAAAASRGVIDGRMSQNVPSLRQCRVRGGQAVRPWRPQQNREIGAPAEDRNRAAALRCSIDRPARQDVRRASASRGLGDCAASSRPSPFDRLIGKTNSQSAGADAKRSKRYTAAPRAI